MSVDRQDMQLTLRTRLETLAVLTTGSMSLEVTAATYVRTVGSFITDGFAPGMEVIGTGFAGANNNDASTVILVTALVLTVNRTLTVEADTAGRVLKVDLPSKRAWENIEFDPDQGDPYIEEQFIPGPSQQITVGTGGIVQVNPMYSVLFHIPQNVGIGAINRYINAVEVLFSPRTAMTLTNGDILRVRTDTGPFSGQTLKRKAGWVVAPVTIPLWLQTINP